MQPSYSALAHVLDETFDDEKLQAGLQLRGRDLSIVSQLQEAGREVDFYVYFANMKRVTQQYQDNGEDWFDENWVSANHRPKDTYELTLRTCIQFEHSNILQDLERNFKEQDLLLDKEYFSHVTPDQTQTTMNGRMLKKAFHRTVSVQRSI